MTRRRPGLVARSLSVRIFLAEYEYYTIAFPNSVDMVKLEKDNIEFNPFYTEENLVVSNSKTTQRKLLSKAQLNFIGQSFQLKIISRNNKINILQFISKNIEAVMPLSGSARNYRALPFLLALLSIINSLVDFKAKGNNLEDIEWDSELTDIVLQIVQNSWRLDDIQLRITCGLIYAKVFKLAEPSTVAKHAE